MDAEALERRLDPVDHRVNGVAVPLRELRDVRALIAVLGRLLAAPHRLDRRSEALDLAAAVVEVVLALDRVARELEQACDRVPVGGIAGRPDSEGPVGFAETISTWNRCGDVAVAGGEAVARREDPFERVGEPLVGEGGG